MPIVFLRQKARRFKAGLRCITIRQKLLAGAGLIIVSMVGISVAAVAQLRGLNALITAAVTVDAQILRGTEDLKDLLVAQTGNARKFAITGDPDFRRLFDENTRDFRDAASSLEAVAGDGRLRELLDRVNRSYEAYLKRARAGGQEADLHRAEDAVGAGLNELYEASRRELDQKLASSRTISAEGARAALFAALCLSLFGMLLALLIGRSLYVPLQRLEQATRDIARGDFSKKIQILRQDEIGELSASFNVMTERLLELERLKSDFISSMTHDLKTPLAAITEANQLMLDGAAGEISPRQQRLLNIIREDSGRLMRLITSILDLAKMESGVLNYDLRQADVSLLILEAVESVRFLADGKNIEMSCQPGRSLPRPAVDGDRMRQALINLLSNAIKFTPAGGEVSVDAQPCGIPFESGSRQAVLITITDTGPGIPEHDLPRIFEKFYHGSAGQAGSGLGLTIARHIIQGHGGTIRAESGPQGSTFFVLLPEANP